MDRHILGLLLTLSLLPATPTHAADRSFAVAPSLGSASVSNLNGYKNAAFVRVDGSFYLLPELGLNVFAVSYQDFKTSGSGPVVAIKVNGAGAGLTGKWPVHPHVQPYVRGELMFWNAEAKGLNRTLAKDNGHSVGLAAGVHFPIRSRFGVKAEYAGYNNISGADIRQLSVGLTIEF